MYAHYGGLDWSPSRGVVLGGSERQGGDWRCVEPCAEMSGVVSGVG